MKYVTPHEEYPTGQPLPPSPVDAQTFRLNREFLRAHGFSRGPLTTFLAHDLWIEPHHNGVHPE